MIHSNGNGNGNFDVPVAMHMLVRSYVHAAELQACDIYIRGLEARLSQSSACERVCVFVPFPRIASA